MAALVGGWPVADWLLAGITALLTPNYGIYQWFPDFMDVVSLLLRSIMAGLTMVMAVSLRHHHYYQDPMPPPEAMGESHGPGPALFG